MSNAYVFEDAPADDLGGSGPVGPDEGGHGSPLPFVLLLVTAVVLAAAIILLLIRCCGDADTPQLAVFVDAHVATMGGVR